MHNGGPKKPDKANQRLEEREKSVVGAEVAPNSTPYSYGYDQTQGANNQGESRLEGQDPDRKTPAPTYTAGESYRCCQIAERSHQTESRSKVVNDAFLQDELKQGSDAGGQRQKGIGNRKNIAKNGHQLG